MVLDPVDSRSEVLGLGADGEKFLTDAEQIPDLFGMDFSEAVYSLLDLGEHAVSPTSRAALRSTS